MIALLNMAVLLGLIAFASLTAWLLLGWEERRRERDDRGDDRPS